jgi:hypothetical protein
LKHSTQTLTLINRELGRRSFDFSLKPQTSLA